MEELKVAPNSEAQKLFFAASEDEVLYGGAAGSGKTFAIVIDPLRYINYADYTAIIFRRSYPELEGSVIPLTQKYYNAAGGRYHEQKKLWSFPSGATIKLGFMQHESDWTNYQGHEYAGLYYDELTNFRWIQFEMLKVWNRSRAAGIRPYRRATSNPGGVSHSQVKAYFVTTCPPNPDGEPRFSRLGRMTWQPMKPGPRYREWDPTTKMYLTRRFIPARVFDNEDLLKNNPNYLATLLKLPEHKRRAYVEGDWDVFEGQFFDLRRDVHLIPRIKEFSEMWHYLGAIDYGQVTVLLVGCKDHEGYVRIFHEVKSVHATPTERATAMAESLMEKRIYNLPIAYDTNMAINLREYTGYDNTPIAIFQQVFEKIMGKRAPQFFKVSKASEDRRGYRIISNEAVKEHLRYKFDDGGKLSVRPRLLITPDCPYLLETMPELIHDPDSFEGLDFDQGSGEDHAVDALRYVVMGLMTPFTPKKVVKVYGSSDEFIDAEIEKRIHQPLARKVERQVFTF